MPFIEYRVNSHLRDRDIAQVTVLRQDYICTEVPPMTLQINGDSRRILSVHTLDIASHCGYLCGADTDFDQGSFTSNLIRKRAILKSVTRLNHANKYMDYILDKKQAMGHDDMPMEEFVKTYPTLFNQYAYEEWTSLIGIMHHTDQEPEYDEDYDYYDDEEEP